MADNGTSQPSRAMNWLSVAAVLCLLGEIVLLSTSARSAAAPPPVGVLALALLTLFFGAGSLVFPPAAKPHWFCGRSMAVLAMTAGMVLFSVPSIELHKELEQAQFRHMRQLAAACLAYARSHAGRFPPNLAVLLEEGKITATTLDDPTNALAPLKLPADWRKIRPAQLSALLNKNSDFRYVGADLHWAGAKTPPRLLRRIIIIFTNNQEAYNGGPIGLADGRVVYFTRGKMDRALRRCNEARKKLGLPPLSFDAAPAHAGPPDKSRSG